MNEVPCIHHSPSYSIPFAQLSDADLKALEATYYMAVAGIMLNVPNTYAGYQASVEPAACWVGMSERMRRERVLAQTLLFSGSDPETSLKRMLRHINAWTRPEQVDGMLAYAKFTGLTPQSLVFSD